MIWYYGGPFKAFQKEEAEEAERKSGKRAQYVQTQVEKMIRRDMFGIPFCFRST